MTLAIRLALALLALAGCSTKVVVESAGTGSPGSSGSSGGGGTGGSPAMTGEPPPPVPCSMDMTSDPLNCGACDHNCLGGACTAGICQPVELAKQDGQPWEITLDATRVYWNNTYGEISKVPKQGGTTSVLTTDLVNCGMLAVHGGRVFSASFFGGVEVVSTSGGALTGLTVPANGGVALAVDDSGVYWASGPLTPGEKSIVRTDFQGAFTSVLGSLDHEPTSVTIDGSHVYWTDFTADGTGLGGVRRAPLGGGDTETLVAGDGILQLAMDDARVYYLFGGTSAASWSDCALLAVPKAGGAPVTLAAPLNGATRLAVDTTHVYWTESYGQVIRKVPKTGGAAVTLATSNGNPQGIAVDGEAVYWVDPGNQTIMKVAK